MSRYYKWAQRHHPLGRRIVLLAPAGLLFLILLPYVVAVTGPNLDRRFGLPRLDMGMANWAVGGLLLTVGFFLGFWSILVQVTRGRGTPLPMMPTQELLMQGPFHLCRNPMTLGTVLAYTGIGLIAGTVTGIVFVLCFAVLLIVYLKGMEERELAERFGDAYLQYKRDVPFLIPRLPKRR